MSNVYVPFSQISFPARYSVVNFQLESHSLRFREVITGLFRGAEPEEIAFLMTSLADERCGYFMGADVLVDGGCVNNSYSILTAAKKYDKKSLKENW